MKLKDYKFVVAKPFYGDVYNYCFKDLENIENIDLLDGYIKFKSRLEEKIYLKHFTNKMWLPLRKVWNKRYYKTKFNEKDNLVFVIGSTKNDIFKNKAIPYLRKKYKNSKFVLFLNDLVDKNFVEIDFKEVKKEFDAVISFDYNDCKKYGLYNHPLVYSAPKELENIKEDIDVYFCGRAKERIDLIMNTFKYLKEKNLNCLFILRDVPLEKRENIEGLVYLDKFMSYEQNLEYLKKSKCLLEIMQEGGNGYTLRTCEVVAYNKKMITNNSILKEAEFYDENMMSFFKNVEDIDIDFIKSENGHYKDRNYFSPIKLLEKVVDILDNKED